jgi:hypothetical protein
VSAETAHLHAFPVFEPIAAEAAFAVAVERFLQSPAPPIPTWIGARADLVQSVRLASRLYESVRLAPPADIGVWLGDLPAALRSFSAPFARRWTSIGDLFDLLRQSPDSRVLIAGLYDDLNWKNIRSLLVASPHDSRSRLGFLTGRDTASLCWMMAKQWAQVGADVREIGFFSSVDKPASSAPHLSSYGEQDCDDQDIQKIILSRPWRRVLFQGHGKDDSINLGDFTICGRNEHVPAGPGTLYPRCGYGWPCYKDESKLVPLRLVEAAEIVLSACNSAPLSDLALYDPRFVLLLNAVDGCAQTVTASLSVHDSGAPENSLWAQHAPRDPALASTVLLNRSLEAEHPYPAFWHFGIPPAADFPTEQPAPLDASFAQIALRLSSLLSQNLLPASYPLLPRLRHVNEKVNNLLKRALRSGAQPEREHALAAMRSDLQAIDYSLASRILKNPEDPIMSFGAYYGERGTLDAASVQEAPCACGYLAHEFLRRGLLPSILDLHCVLCLRCGDREFRMAGAPRVACRSRDRLATDESLPVEVEVQAFEDGPVQLGVFVPSYLREFVTIFPARFRRNLRGGERARVQFTLAFREGVPAQAYYYTAFAVQWLGLATCRQHFGVIKPAA